MILKSLENLFLLTLVIFYVIKLFGYCLIQNQLLKIKLRNAFLMTISHRLSKNISLEMKSEGHYKKAAEIYRNSEQYNKMINLYPVLQNTLNECKNENLVK